MPPPQSAQGRTIGVWLAAAVSLLFALGLAAAPLAAADPCDNATMRAENNSAQLPDCRAYEMVTPSYKQGFDLRASSFTDDGRVAFRSPGNFAGNMNNSAGNPYLAQRSSSGWLTTSLSPPGVTYNLDGDTAKAFSTDLSLSLWRMYRHDDPSSSVDFYIRDAAGVFTRVGRADTAFVRGVSADLSHVIFNRGDAGDAASSALHEYVGTGNTGPARPVSVDNDGDPTPGVICPNATSTDARVIVFTTACTEATPQVFARVGGTATVAVSESECTRAPGNQGGACNGPAEADYVGAADDGSRVFFTTTQQLVNGDTDDDTDLYACDIPPGDPTPIGTTNACSKLTLISGAAHAQVENVAAVSKDGTRAYFLAQGVLADNLGVNNAAPIAGQQNLYLWTSDTAHPNGQVRFIAQLDGAGLSRAQLTPDGRYFVFVTSSALVTSGPGADGDGGAQDMYRYDATTNTAVRLSTSVTGTGGDDPNDNADTGDASITSDGSVVIFDTVEALSPLDTDGVRDVYAWHDGRVSLISNGGGSVLWVSPSGRDIFFFTQQPLVAADGDVLADIYTARVDGGFAPTQSVTCSGSECQGELTGAPNLGEPASGLTGQSAPGPVTRGTVSLRAVTAAQRRRLVTTGRMSLRVSANVAGIIRATATATLAGRVTTVASARRTTAGPGTATLSLTLSRKARAQLKVLRRLTVKIAIRHSQAAVGRTLTLKLTQAKTTRTKVKKSSAGSRS